VTAVCERESLVAHYSACNVRGTGRTPRALRGHINGP